MNKDEYMKRTEKTKAECLKCLKTYPRLEGYFWDDGIKKRGPFYSKKAAIENYKIYLENLIKSIDSFVKSIGDNIE